MLRLRAYAKINVALAVGPPEAPGSARPGWHRIASWMVGVALHDTLELERLAPGEASRHEIAWADDAPRPTPIDWPVERDLSVRAHRLLEAHAGRELPVAMRLRKRTPVGAGLGGGSSDCAAALRGINALWSLGLSEGGLIALSTKLGSDVAFFLRTRAGSGAGSGAVGVGSDEPRPALVTGFGEVLSDAPGLTARGNGAGAGAANGSMALTIFMPTFGCPTAEVYRALDANPPAGLREAAVRALIERAEDGEFGAGAGVFNDLEAPACAVRPELGRVLADLRAQPGPRALLTGSGSAVFTLGRASAEQRTAARAHGASIIDTHAV